MVYERVRTINSGSRLTTHPVSVLNLSLRAPEFQNLAESIVMHVAQLLIKRFCVFCWPNGVLCCLVLHAMLVKTMPKPMPMMMMMRREQCNRERSSYPTGVCPVMGLAQVSSNPKSQAALANNDACLPLSLPLALSLSNKPALLPAY